MINFILIHFISLILGFTIISGLMELQIKRINEADPPSIFISYKGELLKLNSVHLLVDMTPILHEILVEHLMIIT